MQKLIKELNMQDPLYVQNVSLNANVWIEEITKLVMRAKSKSALGIDGISYVFLKYPPAWAKLEFLFG